MITLKKRRRFIQIGQPFLILTILTTMLSGCAGTVQPNPIEIDRHYGGVFNNALASEPLSVDTHCENDDQMHPIEALVMESLVAFGENYSVVPMLAESWEVSHNDTLYTFFLRRGVYFHNGKEMTAGDVIASLDRYLRVGCRAGEFNMIVSYKALDEYTISVEIAQPTAAFLYNLAMPECALNIYPKEIIQNRPQNDLDWGDLIGTGPYHLTEHEVDKVIVLQRFDDYQPYPGQRDGLGGAKNAYFDEIRFYVVPGYAERIAGLQEGLFDWIQDDYNSDLLESNPDLETTWDEHAGAHHLLFNHASAPTADPQFRQAVRMALDVEAFGMFVWGGCSRCFRMSYSLWPLTSYYYASDPSCASQYNQHDPEKARELLGDSGYTGQTLVCIAPTDDKPSLNACTYLQGALADELGVNVEIERIEGDLLERLSGEEPWHLAITVFPNATGSIPAWYPGDPSLIGYASEEMNFSYACLEKSTTYAGRLGCLEDVQRIAYMDVIDIKLWNIVTPWLHRNNIQGYQSWYFPRFFGVWKE